MAKQTQTKKVADEALFEYYKRTQDKGIRNELFDKYSYIARILAKRFCGRGIEYDDLYQVASIGLIYAIERFDISKGVSFQAFATPTVTGEIKKYFRDKGNFIKVPRRLYEIFSKAHKIHLANASETENPQDDNVVLPRVISIESELLGGDMRFENTLGQTDDSFLLVEDRDFVEKCMGMLNEKEKEFVHKRYYEEQSQKQIASDMNVSQMYISRMERRLLKKLRDLYFKDET